jgi:hypothetical protein
MKKEANIINSIKPEVSLDEHFDSLDIFKKREMINEFKQSKEYFSKNMGRNIFFAAFSYICSALCYFGVQETWFIYYLMLINVPLSIFLYLNLRDFTRYAKLAEKYEKRLSE